MFLSKRLANLVAHLVAEKAITTELRVQLALERTRFDWLAQTVNELKLERAELYRRIGIYVPTPQIERVAVPPLPGVDDNYTVPASGKVADIGDLLAAARELKEQDARARQATEAGTGPSLHDGFDGFDDIGDEAAAAIGAGHDTAGNLVFRQPSR